MTYALFWVYLAIMLAVGGLCRVGIRLGAFAIGALGTALCAWIGMEANQQLRAFFLISWLGLTVGSRMAVKLTTWKYFPIMKTNTNQEGD